MAVLITRENAAEYARRATISRMARLARERELRESPPPANPTPDATNPYQKSRLTRVRVMMDSLDREIRSCIEGGVEDAARLDRMVSALSRLSEQERVLSGRPLPGSLRPRAVKQSGQPKSSQAIADEGVDDGTPNA